VFSLQNFIAHAPVRDFAQHFWLHTATPHGMKFISLDKSQATVDEHAQ